jgi:allophanate hydrolase subunit 2
MNTDTRQRIGEIDGRRIIDKGDNIKVTYLDGESQTTITGILISTSEQEIEVNGVTPRKKIKIENIKSIEKINNN